MLTTERRLPAAGIVLAVMAAMLWFATIGAIQPDEFTDLGLVPTIPAIAWIALALLVIGFSLTLAAPRPSQGLLFLHSALLILLVYGVPAMIEDVPRFNAAWRHIGIVQHIREYGAVDPTIDAYFNWPGFFVLSAFLADAAGIQDLSGIVTWMPVLLNLAYLGPLLIIMRSVTTDVRLVWMTVWVFLVTNWVGQDYFSPQGFGYLLWMTIIAILLRWFRSGPGEGAYFFGIVPSFRLREWLPDWLRSWTYSTHGPHAESTYRQRLGLLMICTLLFAVVNGSHQLTPFATFGGVVALVVFNQVLSRWLPLLMAVMILHWLMFVATSFWSGHGATLISEFGQVDSAFSQSTVERVRGSDGHLFVVQFRLIFTAIVWAGAAAGLFLRVRRSHRDLGFVLLALAPFPLVAAQSYGGEMLLRIYFFALPFVAFFLASLIIPAPDRHRARWVAPMVAVISFSLLSGMLLARYGNERMEYFSADEVAAADVMYQSATPGSTIFTANWNAPIRHRGYAEYRYLSLNDVHPQDQWVDPATGLADADAIIETMSTISGEEDAYLYLTRSQDAANELLGLSPVSQDALIVELEASGRFRVIHASDDAVLYLLLPPGA